MRHSFNSHVTTRHDLSTRLGCAWFYIPTNSV